MIENEHKLEGCVHDIQTLVRAIDNKFGNVNIHSGYRTPDYNKKIGGAENSQHIYGKAIDISVNNVHIIKVASWLLYNILKYKWTRCAINLRENWLHVDCKDVPEIPIVRFYQNRKWVQ